MHEHAAEDERPGAVRVVDLTMNGHARIHDEGLRETTMSGRARVSCWSATVGYRRLLHAYLSGCDPCHDGRGVVAKLVQLVLSLEDTDAVYPAIAAEQAAPRAQHGKPLRSAVRI